MATKIIRSASQSGWSLRNIHISNENGSFTFYVNVFGPLSLQILLPDLTVYMITRWVSYKKQELYAFREFTPGCLMGYVVFCVVLLGIFTYLVRVVTSAMISTKNDVRFVFTPLVYRRDHGLFMLFVFVAYSVV